MIHFDTKSPRKTGINTKKSAAGNKSDRDGWTAGLNSLVKGGAIKACGT